MTYEDRNQRGIHRWINDAEIAEGIADDTWKRTRLCYNHGFEAIGHATMHGAAKGLRFFICNNPGCQKAAYIDKQIFTYGPRFLQVRGEST